MKDGSVLLAIMLIASVVGVALCGLSSSEYAIAGLAIGVIGIIGIALMSRNGEHDE